MNRQNYYSEKARQYTEEGFCVLENILEPKDLGLLKSSCEEHLRALSSEHREKERSTGSMINLAEIPELAGLIANKKALCEFEKMGFGDVRFSSGYLISKPPKSPPLFWHFDWAAWGHPASFEKIPLQTFFMYYLVDTTIDNGCLKVIPRSHLEEHPLHEMMRSAHSDELKKATNLESKEFQSHPDEVNVCVKAGDLVIGDSRIIHGSHPNNSELERPVITIWMHPEFSSLPEELQAFCKRHNYSDWSKEAQKVLEPLKPIYEGNKDAAPWNRIRPKMR